MQYGWVTVDEEGGVKHYYLRAQTGTMVTEWRYIDGHWRYFKAYGWQFIDGSWYYLFPVTGVRVTGPRFLDGGWKLFGFDGKLLSAR